MLTGSKGGGGGHPGTSQKNLEKQPKYYIIKHFDLDTNAPHLEKKAILGANLHNIILSFSQQNKVLWVLLNTHTFFPCHMFSSSGNFFSQSAFLRAICSSNEIFPHNHNKIIHVGPRISN